MVTKNIFLVFRKFALKYLRAKGHHVCNTLLKVSEINRKDKTTIVKC